MPRLLDHLPILSAGYLHLPGSTICRGVRCTSSYLRPTTTARSQKTVLVAEATIEALESLKQSGRKLILVTGRELSDLRRVFSRLDLFDAAVVENGAVLFEPATGEEIPLGDEPPPLFVDELKRRNVTPNRSAAASAGNTTKAPLLKTICSSSPSSRMVSRTFFSFGSHVATPRPIARSPRSAV